MESYELKVDGYVYVDICHRKGYIPGVVADFGEDNEQLAYIAVTSGGKIYFMLEDVPYSELYHMQRQNCRMQPKEEATLIEELLPCVLEKGYFEDVVDYSPTEVKDKRFAKALSLSFLSNIPIIQFQDLIEETTRNERNNDVLDCDDFDEDICDSDSQDDDIPLIDPKRFFTLVKKAQVELCASEFQRELLGKLASRVFLLAADKEKTSDCIMIMAPSGSGKTYLCNTILREILNTAGIKDVRTSIIDASQLTPSAYKGGNDVYDVFKEITNPLHNFNIFILDEADTALLQYCENDTGASYKLQKQLLSIACNQNMCINNSKTLVLFCGAFADYYTDTGLESKRSQIGFAGSVSKTNVVIKPEDWLRKHHVIPELISRLDIITYQADTAIKETELKAFSERKITEARRKLSHVFGLDGDKFNIDFSKLILDICQNKDAGSYRLISQEVERELARYVESYYMQKVSESEITN